MRGFDERNQLSGGSDGGGAVCPRIEMTAIVKHDIGGMAVAILAFDFPL